MQTINQTDRSCGGTENLALRGNAATTEGCVEKGHGAGAAKEDEDDGADGEDKAAAPGPEAVDGLRLGR